MSPHERCDDAAGDDCERREIADRSSYDVETAEVEDPVFMARILGKP
jgi:hypothetical protein